MLRAGETATVTIGGSAARSLVGPLRRVPRADVWTENSVALILKVSNARRSAGPNLDDFPQPRNFRPPRKNIRERARPTGIPKTV